jgi:MerR family transcriptional regulator, copper efflux regulator
MVALPLYPTDALPACAGGEKSLKIGDVAKMTGKTNRALRLYEELGLLAPGAHSSGGFRLYGDEAVARVQWITKLQDLGFTLQDIQELVSVLQAPQPPREAMARVRSLYDEKLTEVAQQLARLSTLRDELQASLQYLQECVACDRTVAAAHEAAHQCRGCSEHSHEAPALVNGLTAPSSTRTT